MWGVPSVQIDKCLQTGKQETSPDLNLESYANQTSSSPNRSRRARKKYLRDVNKDKRLRKLKFIWTFNGRIYIKIIENSPVVALTQRMILESFRMNTPVRANHLDHATWLRTENGFSIFHWNMRSLSKNVSLQEDIFTIVKVPPEIIAILKRS